MSRPPEEDTEAIEAAATEVNEAHKTSDDAYIIEDGGKAATAGPGSMSDAVTKALDFLSSASNETLTACLVGAAAATYMVLGRVGLLIIGVAGGVVLHASWEGDSRKSNQTDQETKRRKEAATEIAHRLLDWRKPKGGEEDSETEQDLYAGNELDQVDLSAPMKAAIEELIDAAIRDYVRWWYTPLLPRENTFPTSCRKLFTSFILSMNAHLSRKRPADAFLDFLTNSSSIVIVFLHELTGALANSNEPVADAIEQYLAQNPDGNLANVLDMRLQRKKFSMIAEDIINAFLEPSARNCEPVRLFMREMIGGVSLEMTLDRCSKPDWINGWIVNLLEETQVQDPEEAARSLQPGYHNLPGESGDRKAQTINNSTEPESEHKRLKRASKAEEAMAEAMREAKRLSQLIAEEEERKKLNGTPLESESAGTEANSQDSSPQQQQRDSDEFGASQTKSQRVSTDNYTNGYDSPAEGRAPASTFDEFLPASSLHASLAPISKPAVDAPLTLHNASISLMEGTPSKEKSTVRSKPTADFLIQIEPASTAHSGWMIVRKYADFEMLHEVLRRISVISGVTKFAERHAVLPDWRGQTNGQIRLRLQAYLGEALRFQQLAESEGMKRFLEKEQALRGQGANKQSSHGAMGWPSPAAFETMGKGMLEALAKAPTHAAEGGKTLLGGVTGVLGTVGSTVGSTVGAVGSSVGNLGQRKPVPPPGAAPVRQMTASAAVSSSPRRSSSLARQNSWSSINSSTNKKGDNEPAYRPAPIERRTSVDKENLRAAVGRSSSIPRLPALETRWDQDNALRIRGATLDENDTEIRYTSLPPMPSEIPDDYTPGVMTPSHTMSSIPGSPAIRSATPSLLSGTRNSSSVALATMATSTTSTKQSRPPRVKTPLNEQETRVALELMFAMVSELYSLSSAWTLRRTLLTAAKNYLLRPGNPSMDSIRLFLQDGIIDNTVSDIPYYIKTVRQNALPTEKELAGWPPELTPKEGEALRIKARKLLVEKGMPPAISGVMGTVATGEALGKVFDCLQIEKVARGFMFGILLQALRAIVQ